MATSKPFFHRLSPGRQAGSPPASTDPCNQHRTLKTAQTVKRTTVYDCVSVCLFVRVVSKSVPMLLLLLLYPHREYEEEAE